MLQPSQIKSKLKQAYWDSDYNPEDLYLLLNNKIDEVGGLTKDKLYIRLLETYSWYNLLEIIPHEKIIDITSTRIISKLRNSTLKERYELISKLLLNTTISKTGKGS